MNKLAISAFFLVVGCASVCAQTKVFDATPAYVYYIGNFNTMGEVFQLSQNNASITSFDVDLISQQETIIPDMQLQVTFFSGFQTQYTGGGNEFSNPVMSQTFDLGGQFFDANTENTFTGLKLNTPVAVSGNQIGVQFSWVQNSNGVVTPASGITIAENFSNTTAPAVGANGFGLPLVWGGATTDSSTSLPQTSYLYSGDTYQNLGVTLYAATPEPSSYAFLGLGVVGLLAHKRRGRNRKS